MQAQPWKVLLETSSESGNIDRVVIAICLLIICFLGLQWDVDIKSEVEQNGKRDPSLLAYVVASRLFPHINIYISWDRIFSSEKKKSPQTKNKQWKKVLSDTVHTENKCSEFSSDSCLSLAQLNIYATVSVNVW